MARFTQNITLSTNQAADVSGVSVEFGGRYLLVASATWGGGNIKLQILGPDGATYLDLPSATLSANGTLTVYLPDNAVVKLDITTATAVYAALRRCPEC